MYPMISEEMELADFLQLNLKNGVPGENQNSLDWPPEERLTFTRQWITRNRQPFSANYSKN